MTEDPGAIFDKSDLALDMLSLTLPKAHIDFDLRSRITGTAWDERLDKLWLLLPEEFDRVLDGDTLVCIDGTTKVKGTDEIDLDTRFGYTAYGFLESQLS